MFAFFTNRAPLKIDEDDYVEIDSNCDPAESLPSINVEPTGLNQQPVIASQILPKQTNNAASDARKLEWDQNKRRYATTRDKDGNRVEIKWVSNNTKLAYWDVVNKKTVHVEENKNDHTFGNGRFKDIKHHSVAASSTVRP